MKTIRTHIHSRPIFPCPRCELALGLLLAGATGCGSGAQPELRVTSGQAERPVTEQVIPVVPVQAQDHPQIRTTHNPPLREPNSALVAPIAGEVLGVDPRRCRVVIYALVDRLWIVQPLKTAPLTEIGQDGKWQTRVYRGADDYAALLVEQNYQPAERLESLPRVAGDILAMSRSQIRFSFEADQGGWTAYRGQGDSMACVQASRSSERTHEGKFALKLVMDLAGGHSKKSRGEAYVNLKANPPKGETVPLELKGRTITVWVFAPKGAAGDAGAPNGFQIFVKDKKWKGNYGPWHNVVEGEWQQISMTVGSTDAEGVWIAEGFDPHSVIAVGVKMGAGDGSTESYQGPVYIDEVNW